MTTMAECALEKIDTCMPSDPRDVQAHIYAILPSSQDIQQHNHGARVLRSHSSPVPVVRACHLFIVKYSRELCHFRGQPNGRGLDCRSTRRPIDPVYTGPDHLYLFLYYTDLLYLLHGFIHSTTQPANITKFHTKIYLTSPGYCQSSIGFQCAILGPKTPIFIHSFV